MVPVLRRVRVNPRIAGTELAGTERGTPIPIPPPTRWRPSLTRNPRNTAETRGITRGPMKHSHTFGREFHSVQNLGSTIEWTTTTWQEAEDSEVNNMEFFHSEFGWEHSRV